MDVIYDLMIFDVGIQALKMRVQASKMWILAKKIVKSAELYIDTIHPSIHPSIHIQMALWGTNESKLGSLAGFDPVDLFPEMGSLQQKAVLLSFPTQAEGITIPIIWLGNT